MTVLSIQDKTESTGNITLTKKIECPSLKTCTQDTGNFFCETPTTRSSFIRFIKVSRRESPRNPHGR